MQENCNKNCMWKVNSFFLNLPLGMKVILAALSHIVLCFRHGKSSNAKIRGKCTESCTLKANTCVAALLYAGESVFEVSLEFGSDLKIFFLR